MFAWAEMRDLPLERQIPPRSVLVDGPHDLPVDTHFAVTAIVICPSDKPDCISLKGPFTPRTDLIGEQEPRTIPPLTLRMHLPHADVSRRGWI